MTGTGARNASRVALAVLAAAAWLALPASATAASIGGFSVRPAHFNPAIPATRAYFEPTIRAGSRYSDEVVISNNGSTALQLRVYPVDGVTAVTSGAVYTNRGVALHGAGRWVKPATSMVQIAPGGQATVGFVVAVPAGTSPGDHLAGLAVENAHPLHSGGRFSITEVIRAVVGISIVVPGPASPQIRLEHLRLSALPGTQVPSAVVTLLDAGRKYCKPTLAVSLTGPRQPTRTVTRHLDTILPGDAIPYPLEWPRPLRAGTYSGVVKATGCGSRQDLRTHARLGAALAGTPADPQPRSSAAGSPAGTPIWLIGLIGVGGIALGSAGALRLAGRRSSAAT